MVELEGNQRTRVDLTGRKRRSRIGEFTAEIERTAREIVVHRADAARRTAALEMVAKRLDEACVLLKYANAGAEPLATPNMPNARAPSVVNPCAWCGQPGVFRPKPSHWNPNPAWLCAAHKPLDDGASITIVEAPGLNEGVQVPPSEPSE